MEKYINQIIEDRRMKVVDMQETIKFIEKYGEDYGVFDKESAIKEIEEEIAKVVRYIEMLENEYPIRS